MSKYKIFILILCLIVMSSFVGYAQYGDGIVYPLIRRDVSDGDKGDILVTGNGTVWSLDPNTGTGSGDITAVWSDDSGDVSALTATSGDTLNATNADSTIPWKVNNTAAPTTEGMAIWDADNDILTIGDGSGTDYAAYGASDGDALAGDSATSFFDAGTIEHERGGLEADISAYTGLVGVSGGSTSEVDTSAGVAANISDETGSGALAFATSPTFTTSVLMANGSDLKVSTTTSAHEFSIQTYDNDDTTWRDVFTFTNGNSPGVALGANTTLSGVGTINLSSIDDYQVGAVSLNDMDMAFTVDQTLADTKSIKTETDTSDDYSAWEATDDVGGTPVQIETIRVMNSGTSAATTVTIGNVNSAAIIELDATADQMANEGYCGIVITGKNAGEAIDQGNPVFWDATAQEWLEADADEAAHWPARGIALATGSDGNPLDVLVQGIMRHDDWTGGFTLGDTIYLGDDPSDNAGIDDDAPATSGDCVQAIGWALSDDEVYFNFSGHYLEVE